MVWNRTKSKCDPLIDLGAKLFFKEIATFNPTRMGSFYGFGPRESKKAMMYSDIGRLNCNVSYTTFATPVRGQASENKDISSQLHKSLEGAIMLDTFPKTTVDVFALILESGGCDLPVVISCASLALADAGIMLYDLVAAVSVHISYSSGGFDINVFLKVHRTGDISHLPDVSVELVCNTLEDAKKPIVTAVQGLALGGGLEVAMICKWTNDTHLLSAIMVLMISIKGACRNGWFGEKDNEELHIIWTDITKRFCSAGAMNSGESTVNDSISTVMSRIQIQPGIKSNQIQLFFNFSVLGTLHFKPSS